jgi:hypothetical protein
MGIRQKSEKEGERERERCRICAEVFLFIFASAPFSYLVYNSLKCYAGRAKGNGSLIKREGEAQALKVRLQNFLLKVESVLQEQISSSDNHLNSHFCCKSLKAS